MASFLDDYFGAPVRATTEFLENPNIETFGGALLGAEDQNWNLFNGVSDVTPGSWDNSITNFGSANTVDSPDFRRAAGWTGAALGAYYGLGALGAGEGAAGGAEGAGAAGAAESSPWVESSSGMMTLPGEGGSSTYGSLAEPSAGFDWMKLAQQGMKMGQGMGNKQSSGNQMKDDYDPYGLKLSGLPTNSFELKPETAEAKRQKIIDAMTKKDEVW